MHVTKHILILSIFFSCTSIASALNVDYQTIVGSSGNNILVEDSQMSKDTNYICNIGTLACNLTKKTTIGKKTPVKIKKSLKADLDANSAHHITFSPSGKLVAYYIPWRDTNNVSTFVLRDIKSKSEYRLGEGRSYWDLVTDLNRVFDFSPNSKYLAYMDDVDGYMSIYVADTTKQKSDKLTSARLKTSALTVADFLFYDSQTIYYVGNNKDNPYIWSLYRYNIKTGKEKLIESNVSFVDKIKRFGDSIVFSRLQNIGYGLEVYRVGSGKLSFFKIPNINTTKPKIDEEYVQAGLAPGVLMHPAPSTSGAYPLVIWLHGGPVRQTSYGYHPYHSYGTYDSILKVMQKNGVVVLKLDYRGSIGFGRSYSEGIKENVGKGDIDDVMSAISYAKSRYNISNVYLMGNSYGGYMSLKSVVEHPEAFSGIVSINGVTDWESLIVKLQKSIFNTQFNGLPDANNRYLYDQASIVSKIGNIGIQKIDIIAGEADKTIPFWQATDLYEKLKSQGKNVTLVSYPGEDHVYKKKETISDLCVKLLNFIDKPSDPDCTN